MTKDSKHTPSEFLLFRYQLFVDSTNFQPGFKSIGGIETPEELYKQRNNLFRQALESLSTPLNNAKLTYSIEQKKSKTQYLLLAQAERMKKITQQQEDFLVPHQPYSWIAVDMMPGHQVIGITSRTDLHARYVANKLSERLQKLLKNCYLDLQIEEIRNPRSFWKIAEEHVGKIRQVCITINPPNMPELTDAFDKELTEFTQSAQAKQTDIILKSHRGQQLEINENNPKLAALAHYADNGGGNYYFKTTDSRRPIKPIGAQESLTAAPIAEEMLIEQDIDSPKTSILTKLRKLGRVRRRKQ